MIVHVVTSRSCFVAFFAGLYWRNIVLKEAGCSYTYIDYISFALLGGGVNFYINVCRCLDSPLKKGIKFVAKLYKVWNYKII